MIGASLGPYKIIEQLGAGGMGEVYLGEDTRLGRKVAIKVLPAEFASDAERLARFEQEARAAAALNHPHIAAVFDVGTEGETHFMVQEYLEGDTLREPLKKGALPLKKGLDLATEIAEALAAAHAAGIIHRDLKPENIFITTEGHAKVLDFGLAKLMETARAMSPGRDASKSPTMLGTVAGQVMGTAGYMAPEQVQGDGEIDHRADLFAFGCVLYEMVSGRQPFSGKNVIQTLDRIVNEEPVSIGEINSDVPAESQRIIRKCLAKEPVNRYQGASDLVVDLRTLGADVDSGTAVPVVSAGEAALAPIPATPRSRWLLPAVVAWAAAASAYAIFLFLAEPPPEPVVATFSMPREDRDSLEGLSTMAVSPDGTKIVYRDQGPAGSQLWLREIGSLEATPIPATTGAEMPFFSPDSRSLVFVVGTQLRSIDVEAGTGADVLAQIRPDGLRGGAWGADGTIVVGKSDDAVEGPGLQRLNRSTGEQEPITEPEAAGESHRFPQFLPDGRVLFTIETQDNDARSDKTLAVISLDSGEITILEARGTQARWVPTGHLLYVRNDALVAQPFDAERLEATGPEAVVVRDVAVDPDVGNAQVAISDNGVLLYQTSTGTETRLAFVDGAGEIEPLHDNLMVMSVPRISPDGRRIALSVTEDQLVDIWMFELRRRTFDRFTNIGSASAAMWSPDGSRLLYASSHLGQWSGFIQSADGVGEPEHVDVGDLSLYDAAVWHPNGQTVAFGSVGDIWTYTLGDAEPQQFSNTEFIEGMAAFSPDGNWLAFASEQQGREQVYVTPYPGPGRRWIASIDGGYEPMWARDGSELFYRRGADMMAVSFDADADPPLGSPERLFSVPAPIGPWTVPNYDVTADGRFVMLLGEQDVEPPQMVVVVNWFERLRELAPVER